MKMRYVFLALLFIGSTIISFAQDINIVGKWKEQNTSGISRTWVFNANGTKTLIGTMPLTYPLGGINCSFDLYQERTEEQWSIVNNNTITFKAIPLVLRLDVKNLKQSGLTQAQKTKIKNAIPSFKQQAIQQSKNDWARSMVGKKYNYIIDKFAPERMVIISPNGQSFTLLRDTTSMTPAEKKAFHTKLEQIEAEDQVKEDEQKAKAEAEKKMREDNDDRIFEVIDEKAQFPGGDDECYKWLSEHIKYPAIAQEQGIQGIVFMQFVVEKDGTLSDIKVMRSPDPSLSQEAIRVVKEMPKWIPARQGGKDVRSRHNLPVMFRL